MNQVQELEKSMLPVPEQAKEIIINSVESYGKAGDILLTIKQFRKKIDETFNPIIQKAHEAHKEALNQKKKVAKPLDDAEKLLKPKIANYLDWIARKKRTPRAVYLRRLIEEDMKASKLNK